MAVTAEAGRLKRAGVDIVAFGAGEPDFPTPDNIKRAAVQAIEENFTRYTPAGGIPSSSKPLRPGMRAISARRTSRASASPQWAASTPSSTAWRR